MNKIQLLTDYVDAHLQKMGNPKCDLTFHITLGILMFLWEDSLSYVDPMKISGIYTEYCEAKGLALGSNALRDACMRLYFIIDRAPMAKPSANAGSSFSVRLSDDAYNLIQSLLKPLTSCSKSETKDQC